jgi:O-antigen ligase
MTTSFGDSTGRVYGAPEAQPVGVREHIDAARSRLLGPNRERMLIGLVVYTLWALLLVRAIFGGQTSRAVLLVLPLVLLAANRLPRAALLASIPAATFGNVVLSSWLSFRAYALIVAIAGLGVVTRRWRLLPLFHGTVLLLVVTVVGSAFTNEATVGGLSVRMLSLYTAMALLVMASAAMIRPQVDHVLLMIAATGAAVGLVVLAGWFRSGRSQGAGGILRVFALGLNPNSLGLLTALGAVAAIGIAVQRRNAWFAVLAVPSVLALPDLKSRTALLVMVAGLVWLAVTVPGRRRMRLVAIGTVAAVVMLVRPSIWSDIYRAALGARADLDLSRSDEFRSDVARFAFELGLDRPLTGVGFGQFPAVAGGRFAAVDPSAHNEFLRYFAELGVVGLGLLVALVVLVARATWRLEQRAAAGGVLALFALAMFTVEPLQNLPTTMGVAVLAGAVVGAGSSPASQSSPRMPLHSASPI